MFLYVGVLLNIMWLIALQTSELNGQDYHFGTLLIQDIN